MTADTAGQKWSAPLWWRIARGTVRGTATVCRIAYIEGRYTYGVARTRMRKHVREWKAERSFSADDRPEIDEVPMRRRRLFRAQYHCFACKRKYASAYGLNKHFSTVHGSEPVRFADRDKEIKIIGRDGTSKVRVRPAPSRPPRGRTTTTNTRSTTVDSVIAQAIRTAWAHMQEARPKKLSEIRADMVGLEQALAGHGVEAVAQYRAWLIGGVHFDPVTVQGLKAASEALEEAGRAFSKVIATIDEVYAKEIAAALKAKGGQQPSANTLGS